MGEEGGVGKGEEERGGKRRERRGGGGEEGFFTGWPGLGGLLGDAKTG